MLLDTRLANLADLPFLRATHHAAYHDVTVRQFGTWDLAQQDEFFQASWDLGGIDVILVDDAPCGYCQIELRPDDVHVREIVIAPEFQGRGIGTAFLQHLQGRARAWRIPIRLGTLHQNRALALYTRLGFIELQRTDTHVLMEWSTAGEPLDADPSTRGTLAPPNKPLLQTPQTLVVGAHVLRHARQP